MSIFKLSCIRHVCNKPRRPPRRRPRRSIRPTARPAPTVRFFHIYITPVSHLPLTSPSVLCLARAAAEPCWQPLLPAMTPKTRCQQPAHRTQTHSTAKDKNQGPTLPVQHGAPPARKASADARGPTPAPAVDTSWRASASASASASAASSPLQRGPRQHTPAGCSAHDTPPRRWRALTARRATA